MRLLHKLTCILLLTFACMVQVNAEEERIFSPITASFGLADNSAQTIICTFTGRMTITTVGNINFYDGARFSHIDTDQENWYKLDYYTGRYHLYYDNVHHLWLKDKHRVISVNLTTEKCITNMDSLFVSLGAKSRVDDMFIDHDGNVWMVTSDTLISNKYGVRIAVSRERNLQDLEVYDKRQLLLFFSDGKLECYDVESGEKLYENQPYDEVTGAAYKKTGVLKLHENGLFQIRNGDRGAILLHYDIDQRTWSEVMRSDYSLNNMVIHGNKLYVAAALGYFTYDLNTGEIVHVKSVTLRTERKLETDINTIEFDRQGGMWMGTEKRGILYGRPVNAPFHVLDWEHPDAVRYVKMMEGMEGIGEFNGKRANVMFKDSRQWTWVGMTSGLYLYKTPHDAPVVFTRKNGLLNSVIHAIIEDDNHNIWVSTSYGISTILIENNIIKRVFCFNDRDNVPNETFIKAKAMKLDDGTIVMQALDHVVTFQPNDFDSLFYMKPIQMFPKLTQMLVNGTEVSVGVAVNGSVILDKAITRTKEINLNYDQNSLTLTFSALNYARPLQTHYRAKVREIGNQWQEYNYFNSGGMVDSRGLLHLPLNGLAPGDYHVSVQATMVPGQYVGDALEWVIHVNQPWWRTSGVFIAVALVLLILALANLYLFMRNTRMRERRKSNEGDVVKRIKSFADRCDAFGSKPLAPSLEEKYGNGRDAHAELSPEFVEAMTKILPHVRKTGSRTLNMQMLSEVTGIETVKLYEIMSANLYKSPRPLVLTLRLQQASALLQNTNKTVEEVADECGFATPNFFIASFYHMYKMTPKQFSESLS